jgi:hypothetical protein
VEGADKLWSDFIMKSGLDGASDVRDVVEAVRRIPYGRPTARTAEGVVRDWRGTCSTKHELLAIFVRDRWPDLQPRIMHRVYNLTPDVARTLFGEFAAGVVPVDGVRDVHTYMTAIIGGRRLIVDATVPGPRWNGNSDMPLACGDGTDVDGGSDPRATKARLIAQHCDAAARDRVIEGLSATGSGDE